MIHRMKLARSRHGARYEMDNSLDRASQEGKVFMRNVGLVSAGITVLAIGVVVGRELRARYKFHRRTPYDLYAHAGDPLDVEFGVGV
jgi:hypothetical protein